MSKELDNFYAGIEKSVLPYINDKPISQEILALKHGGISAWCKKNPEIYYTFCGEPRHKKFGFCESLVNQLMKLAYERGEASGKNQGYVKGYQTCENDIREKLGFE